MKLILTHILIPDPVQLCQSVELSTQWCKTAHSLYNNFEELSHHKDLPQCTQLWRVVEHFMQDDVRIRLTSYNFILRSISFGTFSSNKSLTNAKFFE